MKIWETASNVPSDEELAKMTPRQFAEWMVVDREEIS
jgi:hypothetical protein